MADAGESGIWWIFPVIATIGGVIYYYSGAYNNIINIIKHHKLVREQKDKREDRVFDDKNKNYDKTNNLINIRSADDINEENIDEIDAFLIAKIEDFKLSDGSTCRNYQDIGRPVRQ